MEQNIKILIAVGNIQFRGILKIVIPGCHSCLPSHILKHFQIGNMEFHNMGFHHRGGKQNFLFHPISTKPYIAILH